MKRIEMWKLLIVPLAIFWLIFAFFLSIADIPFYIVSMALIIVLCLSALVVALAWAYQHNI